MSVYYAVGLGRADSRNGEPRNVSARRAKERHRFSLLTTTLQNLRGAGLLCPLVRKLRSVTVGEDDVVDGLNVVEDSLRLFGSETTFLKGEKLTCISGGLRSAAMRFLRPISGGFSFCHGT